MKKLMLILVCLIMVLNCPAGLATGWGAITDDVRSCGDYQYRVLEDGTAEIIRWSGADTELTIAAELDGYKVSGIGTAAFYYCRNLVSVIIPNCVTKIGDNAFYLCNFITSIEIPNSVAEIGDLAFGFCGIQSITIPDSVKIMGNNPFYACMSLTEIQISLNHQCFDIVDGALVDTTKQKLICLPSGKKNSTYIIPHGIKEIGFGAISENHNLTSIEIPNTVTKIGSSAFCYTSLEAVIIPDSVRTIDGAWFMGCDKLKSVSVSKDHPSLSSINGILFDKSGKELLFCPAGFPEDEYHVPEGVTCIGEAAFSRQQQLKSIYLPECVTTIMDRAFDLCNELTSISIPDSLTHIVGNPFVGCESLDNVVISKNHPQLKLIDCALIDQKEKRLICCFEAMCMENYEIPQQVVKIEGGSFFGNERLRSVRIREGVSQLGVQSFAYCSNLTTIELPESIAIIDLEAFGGCFNLMTVTIPTNVTHIGPYAFGNCPNLTLTVDPGSVGETYAISENIPYVYAN